MKNFLIILSTFSLSVYTALAEYTGDVVNTGRFLRGGFGKMGMMRDDFRGEYGSEFGYNMMHGNNFSFFGHFLFMLLHLVLLIVFIAIAVFVVRVAWEKAGKICCNGTKK